jgi:hypothetical protein
MATDREQWADTFSADHSGGWLSGFLAEEDEFDRRALWRLGSWGVGSIAAVVIALYANQSSIGLRREQVAAADLVRQAQQIQSVAKESQNETRRLASAIDTLNGDRDRLYSRISTLEQGLDTVTGSIRQNGATSPASLTPSTPTPTIATSSNSTSPISPPSGPPGAPTASDPPPANTMSTVAKNNPITTTAVPGSPAPTPAPPSTMTATTTTTPPDKPGAIVALPSIPSSPSPATPAPSPPGQTAARPEQTNNATAAAITAPPAPVTPAPAPATTTTTPAPTTTTVTPAMTTAAPVTTTVAPVTATLAPVTTAPLMPAKSIMAPPDPAAAKLTEPDLPANPGTASTQQKVTTANAPATTEPEAGQKTEPAIAVQRTEFGVDLGGANSVDGLRALWRGLLKYRSSKVLAELRPLIVVKERNNGLGMQLRLVAGPLNDAATAAKICAAMSENNRPCETTLFDGQRLALKSENGGSSDSSSKTDSTAPAPAAVAPDRPAQASSRSFHRRGAGAKRTRAEEVSEKDAAKPPSPKSSLSQYLGLR